MNDLDLIAHIRKGENSKALNTLYRHFSSVQKMILANNGSKADSEDVFQEALIILLRKISRPEFTP